MNFAAVAGKANVASVRAVANANLGAVVARASASPGPGAEQGAANHGASWEEFDFASCTEACQPPRFVRAPPPASQQPAAGADGV